MAFAANTPDNLTGVLEAVKSMREAFKGVTALGKSEPPDSGADQ